MKSKAVEWGIAGALFVIAIIISVFKGGTEKAAQAPDNDDAEDEPKGTPEDVRRSVMAEMGAKGGKISKRGKAKKKEEDI